PEPGLHERGPRLGAADAVDAQPPALLEVADGCFGRLSEDERFVGGLVAGIGQAVAEVPDGLPRGPSMQQGFRAADYRNSASSWSNCPLPLAPIRRFLAIPSWKPPRVGMLMISWRAATSR